MCEVSEIEYEIEESAAIIDRILNTKRKIEKVKKTDTSQGRVENTNAKTPIASAPKTDTNLGTVENTSTNANSESAENLNVTTNV